MQFHVMIALSALLWATSSVSANSVCSSGLFKDLLFLSAYPPAESFCSSRYPQPTVTVTAAKQSPKHRLRARYAHATTTRPSTTTTSTKEATTTCGKTCSVFTSCTKIGGGFLSTLCSCIESPVTKTVTLILLCASAYYDDNDDNYNNDTDYDHSDDNYHNNNNDHDDHDDDDDHHPLDD
ncbi:hypothetical protein LTR95_016312 [Oleoguttula sp. CCFEE 5521]